MAAPAAGLPSVEELAASLPLPHFAALNALSEEAFRLKLQRCGGIRKWTDLVTATRPFSSGAALMDCAGSVYWNHLARADWVEGFHSRPAIGDVEGCARC